MHANHQILIELESGQVSSSGHDRRRLHCIKTTAPQNFVDQTPEGSLQGMSTLGSSVLPES